MDATKIVSLIQENITHGSYGQEIIEETSTRVFGTIHPITRAEWTDAGQRGIETSFRVDVYQFEYSGELIVEVDGVRYGVYRQYPRIGDDIVELYLHTSGVTFTEVDDVPEEDIPLYVTTYEMLASSGIPTFYGHAPAGQSLPYIVYYMDSSNFGADDRVYSEGYELTVALYTARKDLRMEKALERAFESDDIYWERQETDQLEDRLYVQTYTAVVR